MKIIFQLRLKKSERKWSDVAKRRKRTRTRRYNFRIYSTCKVEIRYCWFSKPVECKGQRRASLALLCLYEWIWSLSSIYPCCYISTQHELMNSAGNWELYFAFRHIVYYDRWLWGGDENIQMRSWGLQKDELKTREENSIIRYTSYQIICHLYTDTWCHVEFWS